MQSLADQSTARARGIAVNMMDNARALPTCPQRQQQQKTEIQNWFKKGPKSPTRFPEHPKFREGDTNGCMEIFARMLVDKDDPEIRNNLAFCQIVIGNP